MDIICRKCEKRTEWGETYFCEECARELGIQVVGEPGTLFKRFLITWVVIAVLACFFFFVPGDSWTLTGGLVFGVIAVFMIAMAWVLSGPIVDS